MDFYIQGLFISFLIGFVKVCISISTLFSIRARNLKKIGLYYSLMSGGFTNTKPNSAIKFVLYSTYVLLIAPIFSWLSVASASWGVIAWLSKRSPVPEKIKEIQWKIAHFDLTKDQLIELQEEIAKITGNPGPIRTGEPSESEGNDDPSTLVLDPGEWYSEVRAIPSQRLLKFHTHTPDYDFESNSTFEYKFEESQLLARLIEHTSHHYTDIERHVKDGVVLESEIRKRAEGSSFRLTKVEDEIAKYTEQVQWQPFDRYDVRFFVMAQHPDLFPHRELRRLARLELERIKLATENVNQLAKKLGVEIEETSEGFSFMHPETGTEEMKTKAEQLFSDEALKLLGTSFGELYIAKKMIADLQKLLGEKKEVA